MFEAVQKVEGYGQVHEVRLSTSACRQEFEPELFGKEALSFPHCIQVSAYKRFEQDALCGNQSVSTVKIGKGAKHKFGAHPGIFQVTRYPFKENDLLLWGPKNRHVLKGC